MTGHSIRIEVPDGEIKSILEEIDRAQEIIWNSYNRLQDLGVLVIKKNPPAATDGFVD